jgi:hypothetical protein
MDILAAQDNRRPGPCRTRPRRVTIALSTHRPETLPAASTLMGGHGVICLEEPPTPGFVAMLNGDLSIADYLPESGTEYPLFTEESCRVLRDRHLQGATIIQVEPYLERLLEIQLELADGAEPEQIAADEDFADVYEMEKAATGALLAFYQTAAEGDVDASADAVLRFAEADARRFRLRDRLRAAALKDILGLPGNIYIEAGMMHLSLIRRLAAVRGGDQRIETVHLQADDTRRLSGRPVLLAPGDRLTFGKIFRQRQPLATERLLAAQSLVYNRIVQTSELGASSGGHPHLTDEHDCISLVSALNMDACRALYPHVHRLPSTQAKDMVAAFVARFGGKAG